LAATDQDRILAALEVMRTNPLQAKLLVGRIAAAQQADAWLLFLFIPGVLLVILCFPQAMVRTIEITLMAIVGPLVALDFLSGNGTADVWWRELLVVAGGQSVQLLLLYMAGALLVAPVPTARPGFDLGPFRFLATLWVALRTPHILRQFAYHTGAGKTTATVGRMVAQEGVSRLLARLPF
jgi:hypothetical protein